MVLALDWKIVTRCVFAGFVAVAATAGRAQQYTLTDIGPVGDELLGAYAVNDAGQVVGAEAPVSGGDHFAFLWTAATGMQILVNVNSGATAINRLGQVTGDASLGDTDDAFFWSAASGVVNIGNLGGPCAGRAINGSGTVVGGSFIQPSGEHCFMWTSGGGLRDLGSPTFFSTATGINDSGVVCGTQVSSSGAGAFTWTESTGFHTIGTLGGSDSYALFINGSGQVVGTSTLPNGDKHPYVWSASGGMVDLGTVGGPTGTAYAINASGTVVGESEDSSGRLRAFVWSPGQGIRDLNTLLPAGSNMVLTTAYGISDTGLIVGTGTVDGAYHAFLLTPASASVVLPDSYQIFRGRYSSGTLADLFADDDSRLNVLAGFVLSTAEAPVQVIVTGTSPQQSPSQLRIHLEAQASTSNLSQKIELWDYTTNAYVQVDSRAATTTDGVVDITVANASRYVEPGTLQMKARLGWRPTGPVLSYPWRAGIDRAVWFVQ